MKSEPLTRDLIFSRLKTVIDPELDIDIVSLGLIYDVSLTTVQTPAGEKPMVHILMTLTTPGCPLIGVLDKMIKDCLMGLEGLEVDSQTIVELTFDPPWTTDMMSEEAKIKLGFE